MFFDQKSSSRGKGQSWLNVLKEVFGYIVAGFLFNLVII